MVLTPAMALIQDDWIAQKIERKQKHAFTKHPETNSCYDVTQAVPAARRAGGHTMADLDAAAGVQHGDGPVLL